MDRYQLGGSIQLLWQLLFIFLVQKVPCFLLPVSSSQLVFIHLGASWIQEHYLTHGDQETKSYYGVLNTVNLNVGYHNEHHDFPSVSWNKLPKVRKIAGNYYDTLDYHTSYTSLLFRFLFDKNFLFIPGLPGQTGVK